MHKNYRESIRDCKPSPLDRVRIVIRILDPDRKPHHPQNLSDFSMARDTPLVKVSCKSDLYLIGK